MNKLDKAVNLGLIIMVTIFVIVATIVTLTSNIQENITATGIVVVITMFLDMVLILNYNKKE